MRVGSVRAFDFVPAVREVRRTREEGRRACDVVPAVAALGDPLQPRRPRPGRATLRRSALLAQLVEHFHGKEGGDGSSLSEGFRGYWRYFGANGSRILDSSFSQRVHSASSSLTRGPDLSFC